MRDCFIIYSFIVLVPSVISLVSTSIVKILPLLPAIVGVYFVSPWFTLSKSSISVGIRVSGLSVTWEIAIAV